VFFCALREDIQRPPLALKPHHRWISAGEATRDLQELTAEETIDCNVTDSAKKYWKKTTQGESFSKAASKDKGKPSHFNWIRLHNAQPSPTLPAEHAKIHHWSTCRPLTFREWKRLGSFPDDYHAKTDKIGKYMIGMSVPPKMAEQVARAVCSQWLGVTHA
jgi:site-specific DNA-cytosine methylase